MSVNLGPAGHAGGNSCAAGTTTLRGLCVRSISGRRTGKFLKTLLHRQRAGGLGRVIRALVSTAGGTSRHVRAAFRRAITTANQLDSISPGLRGVPGHGTIKHRVHDIFIPKRNCRTLVDYSCSRIRLHVVTSLSNSRTLVRTFHSNTSFRGCITSVICNIPISRVANSRHDRMGTVDCNLTCKLDACKLTRRLGVTRHRTRTLGGQCFSAFNGMRSCLRSLMTATHRGNCARAVFNHQHCFPTLHSAGHVTHSTTRHTTLGTPVRNSTTSVVGVTVVHTKRTLSRTNIGDHVVLRVRSRLIIRVTPNRDRRIARLVHGTVRRTISLTIPLSISYNVKSS